MKEYLFVEKFPQLLDSFQCRKIYGYSFIDVDLMILISDLRPDELTSLKISVSQLKYLAIEPIALSKQKSNKKKNGKRRNKVDEKDYYFYWLTTVEKILNFLNSKSAGKIGDGLIKKQIVSYFMIKHISESSPCKQWTIRGYNLHKCLKSELSRSEREYDGNILIGMLMVLERKKIR